MENTLPPDTFVETEGGLREYLHILLQRRWWFGATFVLVVSFVGVYSFTATPIYEATAKLLVETGSVRGSTSSGDALGELMDIGRARTLETQIEIIKSAEVMEPALAMATSIGAILASGISGKSLEELMQLSAETLSELSAEIGEGNATTSTKGINGNGKKPQVKVEGLQRTDIITVACQSPAREFAAIVSNAIVVEYVGLTLSRNQEAAAQGRRFVEDQLKHADKDLQDADRALKEFREQSGITMVSGVVAGLMTDLQAQTERAGELQAAVAADRAGLAAIRRKLRDKQPLIKKSESIIKNPEIDNLRSKLNKLEAEQASVSVEFAPSSQKVKTIREEIKEVEAQIGRETTNVVSAESLVNPVEEELLTQLVMAEVELLGDVERSAAADLILSKTRAKVERLPEDQRSAAELQRMLTVVEKRYLTLTTEKEKLRLVEESTIPSAKVIEAAGIPEGHVRPARKRNLLFATIFGFALGLMVVMLINYLDDTFTMIEDIERELGVSVLSVVYRLPTDEQPLLKSPLGRSSFAEGFRMLRSGLRFSAVTRPIKTLVVTSPGVGEGKSTVSLNLAIACAEGGQRTIIVDADLRRPTLHKVLGLSDSVGLTNCILNEIDVSEAMQSTNYPNLSLIATGPRPPSPGELLDSDRMRELVKKLKEVSDLVIFDTPPAMIIADAQVLARVCDGVLPVMELETTKRPAMRRLVEVLTRAGTAIHGIVVNKARRQPGAYYYYYSYYYYSQYYTDEDEDREEGGSDDSAKA